MYQGLSYEISRVMQEAVNTGLFDYVATFQAPDGNYVGSGQASGNYVNVAGLVAIPCMNAPISDTRIQATEVKELEETEALSIRHVLLDSYYPAIPAADPQGWVVFLAPATNPSSGITYDLLGAESDSQDTQTRVHLRTATI